LNEILLAEFVAAMRTPVSFTAKEAAAAPPVKIFTGMAGLARKGFLQKGFLNPSPAVKAPTHSLLVESVSSLTWEVKDDGVIGLTSLLELSHHSFL
jgi:hypothetical protein